MVIFSRLSRYHFSEHGDWLLWKHLSKHDYNQGTPNRKKLSFCVIIMFFSALLFSNKQTLTHLANQLLWRSSYKVKTSWFQMIETVNSGLINAPISSTHSTQRLLRFYFWILIRPIIMWYSHWKACWVTFLHKSMQSCKADPIRL